MIHGLPIPPFMPTEFRALRHIRPLTGWLWIVWLNGVWVGLLYLFSLWKHSPFSFKGSLIVWAILCAVMALLVVLLPGKNSN